MTGEQVGGIVRAILAAVGGIFVAKGTIDEQTLASVAGAVAVLVTAVWSAFIHRAPKDTPSE